MERDMSSQNTTLCRSGCGFYGSSAQDGLCSKCYKDALKRKQAAPTSSSSVASSSITGSSTGYNSSVANSVVEPSSTSLPLLPPTLNESILSTGTPTIPSAQFKIEPSNGESSNQDIESIGAAGAAAAASATQSGELESHPSEAPKKKKKTRCTQCSKNIGVIGFPCRCGGIFCGQHRYANEHKCEFDYKKAGAEDITKNNPRVVGEKIQKI